jgi:hypothetical protein
MTTLTKSILASFAILLLGATILLAAEPPPAADTSPSATKPQSACPVMGGEIGPKDKALHVDVNGKRIYICCAACESAILADPDKYIKKIEKRGETVEDIPKP